MSTQKIAWLSKGSSFNVPEWDVVKRTLDAFPGFKNTDFSYGGQLDLAYTKEFIYYKPYFKINYGILVFTSYLVKEKIPRQSGADAMRVLLYQLDQKSQLPQYNLGVFQLPKIVRTSDCLKRLLVSMRGAVQLLEQYMPQAVCPECGEDYMLPQKLYHSFNWRCRYSQCFGTSKMDLVLQQKIKKKEW